MIAPCTDLEIAPGGGGRNKNNLLLHIFALKKLGNLKNEYKCFVVGGNWQMEMGGCENLHWLNKPFLFYTF